MNTSDILDTLSHGHCCVRKNPSSQEKLKDNLCILGALSSVYLCSYLLGLDSVCIASVTFMHISFFYIGMNVHEVYYEKNYTNTDMLSLKQREHGARFPKSMTPEQEDLLRLRLQAMIEETNLRNKRRLRSFDRTPSNTTMANVEESTDDDMPPLIPLPKLNKDEVPRFSESHYLHSFLEDYD